MDIPTFDRVRNALGGGDAPPDPREATADDVESYVAKHMEANPRAYPGGDRRGRGDPTVQLPMSKEVDHSDAKYRAEYPWLYDPSRGVRWDFDPIELRVLSQENAWVQMLVQSIVKELGETSWTITDATSASETQKRLSTHPDKRDPIAKDLPDAVAEDIHDRLMSPAPDVNWTDFVEMTAADLLEVGSMTVTKAFPQSAYDGDELVVDSAATTPVALRASAPEVWTKEYQDKTGVTSGYWQFDRHSTPGATESRPRGVGDPIHFATDEVMWTDHSPRTNRRYGIPPTLIVRDFLENIDLATTQEQQYLSRGSIPSGAWVFEEWDREQVKEWKEQNAENIKGKPHKSLMFAGQGGGVDFVPMSMNFSELEFTDRIKYYATVVAAAFQVPTAVVGLEPGDVNYNTFQGERENFESNTLGPYLQQFERFINDQYVRPHYGGDYRFEFTPGMSETTRRMISDRVRNEFNAGIKTRNEARRELGDDPVDDEANGFKDEVVSDPDPDDGPGGPGDQPGDTETAMDPDADRGDDAAIAESATDTDGDVSKREYQVGSGDDATTVDLTPPETMVNAVEAAREASAEYPDQLGDCGTGVGERRGGQIVDDEVGPDVIDEIASYLTSHADDVADVDGPPTDWSEDIWTDGCGPVQYALWGGGTDEALRWAQTKANEVARARGETEPYEAAYAASIAKAADDGDGGGDESDADADTDALRNTDEWHLFDVQPGDIDELAEEIRDPVEEVFDEVLSDDAVQREIDAFAADMTDGSDATEKSLTGLTRRLKEIVADSSVVQSIRESVDDMAAAEIRETLSDLSDEEADDVDTDPIVDAIRDRETEFADEFANRISDDIRETVASGWQDGKNSLEIRDDLQDKAAEFGDWQAERIARQELHVASGEARTRYADETNRVEVWRTSGDDRVRDPHTDMNGTWKRPSERWEVDYSETGRGVQLEKVPGDSRPGIGCRCVTTLVDADEVSDGDHAGVAK